MAQLNGAQIIAKFELYVDDNSEMSTQEELDLLNKIYGDVLNDRPWEFLKKPAAGVATINGSGQCVIALPADFRYFAINHQATDNSEYISDNAAPKVIFMGSAYTPFQIVNFSDRRAYLNRVGFCYLDLANNQIVFTAVPTTDTLAYEFDYIFFPPDITLTTYPIFPQEFHDMLFHGMAVDSVIINLFDRAKSYAKENQAGYDSMMKKLQYYNSQLINN